MKNQPNKGTVKDGLPTAEQVYRKWFGQQNDTTRRALVPNNVIQCMQEYSDQQNAELLERVKELEVAIEESIEIFKSQLFLEHKVNEAWEVLAKALKK